MANKKFLIQYTGTGQGVSRSVVELPIDEKLEGRALDTKIRALAEMKIKKSNRRDRGTIRIVSVKPYNDSAEDSMKDQIESIAAKYGHEMQNDAADVLADFKRNLPALYKKAQALYKSEGAKSPKYIAAFGKLFSEMQRLRQVGMEQKNLYSEYLKKLESTFPSVQ